MNAKTKERIAHGLKKYQAVIKKAVVNDVNESDTVTVICDMLSDVFGFDKFDNITSEKAIRRTFCDLAIKIGEKIPLLIECKAVGIDLKEDHVRQATNYAAESGIEWVVLTNARNWRVYRVLFTQPIDKQLIYSFDFEQLSPRKAETMELLFPLCIEGFPRGTAAELAALYDRKQIFNRYVIGQLLLSEDVVGALRRKMKRLFPEVKTEDEAIREMIAGEIIKREVLDTELSCEAVKLIKKAERRQAQAAKKKAAPSE